MKKIILCLMLLFLFPLSSKATSKTEFLLEKGTITEDEIELHLVMKNNPKFCYFHIEIIFEQENLEYISSNVVGLEKAMLKGTEKNLDGNIVVYAATIPESGLLEDTGKIATIKWKQKEKKDQKFQINVKEYATSEEELPFQTTELIIEKGTTNSWKPVFIKDKVSLKEELKEEFQKEEIIWSSSDEEIATVDENGNVTFLKEGEATIEGKIGDETVYQKEYHVEKKEKKHDYFMIILIFAMFSLIILKIKKNKNVDSNINHSTL